MNKLYNFLALINHKNKDINLEILFTIQKI